MKAMSIDALAELSGMSERAIRLYEQHGLPQPQRTAVGRRTFAEADARRLMNIVALRALGCTLKEITTLAEQHAIDVARVLGMWADRIAAQHLQIRRSHGVDPGACRRRSLESAVLAHQSRSTCRPRVTRHATMALCATRRGLPQVVLPYGTAVGSANRFEVRIAGQRMSPRVRMPVLPARESSQWATSGPQFSAAWRATRRTVHLLR